VAIVLLLLSSLAIVVSGWAVYNDVGGSLLEELHEVVSNLMLAIVAVHVAGVVMASRMHKENLVLSMLTGKKEGASAQGIRRPWLGLAILILAAVLGFWWLQWQSAPEATSAAAATVQAAQYSAGDHDD
jgi:cytochrome b561